VSILGSPATVPTNGSTVSANVNFQRKRGSVQVTKTVQWLSYQPDPGKVFQICLTGPSFPGGDCKTAGYQGSVLTWSNLIPGSYAVSETNPGSEWQVDITGSPAIVPVNGGSANAGVANTRKSNGILVNKVVNWNGITPDSGQIFQICIQGPSYPAVPDCKLIGFNGGLLAWASLLPGSYDVTESSPGMAWQVAINGSPSTVPSDGGNGSASVTNTRKLGGLQVNISVDWGSSNPDPSKLFTICIQGPSYSLTPNCKNIGYNGGLLSWSNLVPGSYVVTETAPGAQWQVTVNGSPVSVPTDGGSGNATIANVLNLLSNVYLPFVTR